MPNLQCPAYPQSIALSGDNPEAQTSWGVHPDFSGFTKLELAALMIAQGFAANGVFNGATQQDYELSIRCVQVAKAVLEEANK